MSSVHRSTPLSRCLVVGLLVVATAIAVRVPRATAAQGPWVLPGADMPAGNAYAYDVGLATGGELTLAWGAAVGSTPATTRPPGGGFGEPTAVWNPVLGAFSGAQLTVAADGTVTALGLSHDDGTTYVVATTRPPGGQFAQRVRLSDQGQNASALHSAQAPDGTTVVTWLSDQGASRIIQASIRPAGGSFGPAVNLSAAGVAGGGGAPVAIAPDGTATAVWTYAAAYGAATQPQMSSRPAGGSFGLAVELPGHGRRGARDGARHHDGDLVSDAEGYAVTHARSGRSVRATGAAGGAVSRRKLGDQRAARPNHRRGLDASGRRRGLPAGWPRAHERSTTRHRIQHAR